MADAPVLRMSSIDKSFAGIPALTNAGLEIAPGEVHALIGQNGAGKSTLIKILNGAYRKDSGDIQLDGKPVQFGSPHEAQLGGVSTIFQEVNLVHCRSVTENIVLGQEPKRYGMIDWPRAHRRAQEILERFGLDLDVRKPLHTCNIAVQQLIAIARAVSFDARLVIMDEPTSSLDEQEKQVLFKVIRDLSAEGVAVLYVSHHLDELFAVCDRVTVMRNGRMIATHEISDVDKIDLVSDMIGRDANQIARTGATGFGDDHAGGEDVVLELRGLSNGTNVRDATLIVHEGEIVGLAGLLGAGRTETVSMSCGADRPVGGSIAFKGRSSHFRRPADAIDAGIGYCTEDRKAEGIIPGLSIRENMTLALLPRLASRGVVPRAAEERLVEGFIGRLGVKTAGMEQPIRELSGGNQQKVLLARWLATEPDLLILDEPTRGIDVGAKREIQSLIEELSHTGLAVLMISSEFEELIEGANRVVVLQEGKTVTTLEKGDLTEDTLLAAVAGHAGTATETDGGENEHEHARERGQIESLGVRPH